jgi:hypothetical protein
MLKNGKISTFPFMLNFVHNNGAIVGMIDMKGRGVIIYFTNDRLYAPDYNNIERTVDER